MLCDVFYGNVSGKFAQPVTLLAYIVDVPGSVPFLDTDHPEFFRSFSRSLLEDAKIT
jgi:hypothetical protein